MPSTDKPSKSSSSSTALTYTLAACGTVAVTALLYRAYNNRRRSKMEKVIFGEAKIPGYEIGDKSAPAIIVLQEWWGVTSNIKAQAEHLAKSGYRCLIPDLYKGKLGVDVEEAHHLMDNLDWPTAKDEICAAAKYLKETGSPSVGAIGFCMGGALTLIGAQHSDDIVCACPFYGTPDPSICQTEKISKPIQAHFGELDTMAGFSDPAAAKKLEENLKTAGGTESAVFMYPGVGHAFLNSLPEPFESFEARKETMGVVPPIEEQTALAWKRVLDFFDKHLKA